MQLVGKTVCEATKQLIFVENLNSESTRYT